MMKKFLQLPLVLILAFVSISCGYTVSSTLPSRLKTLHVELFKNSINFGETNDGHNLYFPMLEVSARNAIVNRFLFDGHLKIVDPDVADLVLKGELKSYNRQPLRYTENNDVLEYRVQVTVALKMWDAQKQEPMWEESGFVGEATYFISGAQATSEESAVNAAVLDLARRIVERTVEYW
ncbi:MAG: hypothetical protein HQL24_03600 [Candidatus Omnitrophica bacterium]|nr:hypothetical protein [Candidatus Omnitrophota bacterium]